ncbi:MAG: Holliday junction branch migration protein RuvA [Candidatus Borkfalkiaceae bacterium]|nr:Holliday junction branch migration protein RuvA [Christensenellaceae bacterium]
MIGYVYGKVMYNDGNLLLVENGGIGYEITCSSAAFCRMMEKREGGIYTYTQVKEDGIALFGFDTIEEKKMFLKLISVSGVGAKMGVTVLGSMNLKDLALAIATSDVKSLSRVKGLGKKTAERIIVELREKVSAEDTEPLPAGVAPAASGSDAENAVTALMSLGYNRVTSVKALNAALAAGASTVEEIIAAALRSLG